jgi:hypothetical protein
MESIVAFFGAWILVSIPSSLIIGNLLARRSRAAEAAGFPTLLHAFEQSEVATL